MSLSQYRSQLERVRRNRAESEKRVGDLRTKEAEKRSAAARDRERASRTKSPTTAASHLRSAGRLEDAANDAGRDAARWQTKAAQLAKEESSLLGKIGRADEAERQATERRRKRDDETAARRAAKERTSVDRRLGAVERLATDAFLAHRDPKRERLRILMLGASSEGDLRVAREQKRIQAAVASALHRDAIELDPRPSATTNDLLDRLSRFRPHVVHFSGHGDHDIVVFEDDLDEPHEGIAITASALAHALVAVDEPPLLIVLNACNSASQVPMLVAEVAPFAIGMSSEIEDGDAILYAARFYAAVADGQSLMSAHNLGRSALEIAGLFGADLPTLGHAEGTDPATTYLVARPT